MIILYGLTALGIYLTVCGIWLDLVENFDDMVCQMVANFTESQVGTKQAWMGE